MLPIDAWRIANTPNDVAIIFPNGIWDKIKRSASQYRAQCGHISPEFYRLEINGRRSRLTKAEILALCPCCAIKRVRAGVKAAMEQAVACGNCGSVIAHGADVGGTLTLDNQCRYPLTFFDDDLIVICCLCAGLSSGISGHWNGQQAIRLSAK